MSRYYAVLNRAAEVDENIIRFVCSELYAEEETNTAKDTIRRISDDFIQPNQPTRIASCPHPPNTPEVHSAYVIHRARMYYGGLSEQLRRSVCAELYAHQASEAALAVSKAATAAAKKKEAAERARLAAQYRRLQNYESGGRHGIIWSSGFETNRRRH